MLEINLTFFFVYFIKLLGHFGSSSITKKHAFEPVLATAAPMNDKIEAIKVIFIPPFYSLCLNINLNHIFNVFFVVVVWHFE